MNAKLKAEEFFEIMINCRKNIEEIPKDCLQGEAGVLFYLAFIQNKITPSNLSKKINVSAPRIASVLNSLESKKMISKKIDNLDKRKTVVEITKDGLKYIINKKDKAMNNLTKVLEKLEDKEVEEYIQLTKKIVSIIDEIHINESR